MILRMAWAVIFLARHITSVNEFAPVNERPEVLSLATAHQSLKKTMPAPASLSTLAKDTDPNLHSQQ